MKWQAVIPQYVRFQFVEITCQIRLYALFPSNMFCLLRNAIDFFFNNASVAAIIVIVVIITIIFCTTSVIPVD